MAHQEEMEWQKVERSGVVGAVLDLDEGPTDSQHKRKPLQEDGLNQTQAILEMTEPQALRQKNQAMASDLLICSRMCNNDATG
jgi:hypothetical protein